MSNLIKKTVFAIAFLVIASPLFADLANDTVWVRSTDQSMGFWMLQFSKNDAIIAANGYNDVLFFETATGNEIGRVPHDREVFFINDDTQFLKPNESKRTIEIWDLATFTVVDSLENDGSKIAGNCVVDEDENYYIGGIENGIRVWNLKTKKIINTFYREDEEGMYDWSSGKKSFIPNTNTFISVITKIYDTNEPKQPDEEKKYLQLFDIESLDSIALVTTFREYDPYKAYFSLSPSGKYIAYKVLDPNYGVEVYDFPSHELKYKLFWNGASCSGVEFSADDKYLVTSSNLPSDGLDIWNIETQENIYSYPIGSAERIAISNNDKYIAYSIGKHLRLLYAHFNPTSIKELDEVNIIFPNPVNNVINLEIDDNIEYTVQISNITGNIIYTDNIINQSIFTYDVSEFISGVYIVQLISNDNIEAYKFIKE